MSWHYVDVDDQQAGPVEREELKKLWEAKRIDDKCICWNENMADWQTIGSLPELLAFLDPPVVEKKSGPPRGGPKPPTGSGPAKAAAAPTAAASTAKPKAAAAAEPQGWKEMQTAEGHKYYYNQALGQTRWEKPEELKTDADREREGEWYWMPHPEHAFLPAKKTASNATKWTLETEDGEQKHIPAKDCKELEKMSWVSLNKLEQDLVMLDVMNKPLILFNLKKRFEQGAIYTNIGTILISINPYKALPLYTPSIIEDYIKRGKRRLPPHVFEIADNAYQNLRDTEQGQSIVISGESGAGKTECTKQCLQYLAEIAGSSSNVEQRILLANPILEAFGNAKTVRNNNSSRFGKYVEIFFDGRSAICGAQNTNYLLEKVRVVQQAKNERNYHIFYQLCKSADAKMKGEFKLKAVKDYNYLNKSGCIDIDGVDDTADFGEVREAFNALGITAEETNDIWRIVSGVLNIGNITLKSAGDRKSAVSDSTVLGVAAALLSVEGKELENAVVTRQMEVKGQKPITVGLSVEEALAARDALAKFIYEMLFDWLVLRINKSIGLGGAKKGRSIGILDIFGFEIFETNQFEQLCINYTNEKLQQFFNAHTFKKEEQTYRSEKIKFAHVEYIDNQPVLDLIEKKPEGILLLVDEELRMPKGSDKTLIQKMLTTHKKTNEFAAVMRSAEMFMVHHYAGDVIYDINGFLEKNKDRLNDDAYDLLSKSKFGFLASMFPDRSTMSTVQKKATLGSKFAVQLTDLMTTLNATEPHYIRCIKPNSQKAPMLFQGKMCLDQLQYAGVFEAVQIRKQGFPFRLTHEDFWKRYKCIFPQEYKWTKNNIANCEILIKDMKQSLDAVQIGTTMVLYRSEQHRDMELRRNVAVEKVTVFIQKFCRQKIAEALLKRCEAIRPVLTSAVSSRNLETLDAALEKAAGVGFEIYELAQAKRMKHVFLEERRLAQVFDVLVKQDPHQFFDTFQREIASADDIELKTDVANKCRTMFAEAVAYRQAVDHDALEQKTVLNEIAMKEVLDRADAVQYSTHEVEHLRKLLYETAETDFIKMQLKAAVQYKDRDRVIGKTIRLKELFFEKAADMFRFKNYPKLYPPMEWANMKLISLKREELAAGMLTWTQDPIHAPLSVVPKTKENPVQKNAVRLFKNILGYMGDRKYPTPNILASELLQNCLQSKELRDEVYCQLIKQLTSNESAGKSKGWDLMLLCLATFPPNPEMENYLEIFLRQKGSPPEKYVNLMHETLYGGGRSSPPSEGEMAQIISQGEIKRTVASLPREEAIKQAPPPPATRGGRTYGAPPRGAPPGAAAPRGGPPKGVPSSPPPEEEPEEPPPEVPTSPAPTGKPPGGAPTGGPPRGGPPTGGPPRGGPPTGGPPRGAAKPAAPEMDQSVEWHYIDSDNAQKGPVTAAGLKAEWAAGKLNGQCIVWNQDMPDWKEVDTLPALKAYVSS